MYNKNDIKVQNAPVYDIFEVRKLATKIEDLFDPYVYYTDAEVFRMTQIQIIEKMKKEVSLESLESANRDFNKKSMSIGKNLPKK